MHQGVVGWCVVILDHHWGSYYGIEVVNPASREYEKGDQLIKEIND